MSFFKEALKPKHKMTIRQSKSKGFASLANAKAFARKSARKSGGRQRIYLSGFIQPPKSVTRKGKHSFGSIFGKPAKQRSVKRVGRRQTIVVRQRQPFMQYQPRKQQMPFASKGLSDFIQPPRQQQQGGQQQPHEDFIQRPQQQTSQVSEQVGGFFQPSAEVTQRQQQTRAELGQAGQNLYKGARTVGESLYGGAKFAYGKAQEVYKKVRPSKQTSEQVEPAQQESIEPTGSEEYQAEEFAEETTQPERNKPKYY